MVSQPFDINAEKAKLGLVLDHFDRIEQLRLATELGFSNPYRALDEAMKAIAGRSQLDRRYRRPQWRSSSLKIALDRELRTLKRQQSTFDS